MDTRRLGLVWVTGDPEAARNMVLMYALNAKLKGWWDEVRLIVWGPSARLLSENAEVSAELENLAAAGVELWACKACADRYGVSDWLAQLGINVLYVGEPFSKMLQGGWTCLTV
ncbi:DsrE family protein [Desulfovibrio sp. X2]|uniref:DsrE family protein n=1 Tax=Desulfovibrio sp. X2 TaxID=941449 RepID=UPI000358A116|nr:DsrE family protein [Desulfovibrio sp. X2]EPR37595.1 DsrE family protein [Desulfovibrio sp. X2]